ncbi:MAG: cytochrome c3 family protein [Desulfovibrionaceae bacterium]
MKKHTLTIAIALLASLFCFLPAFSQDDVMILGGPDSDYGFAQGERAPVTFTHTVHMDLEMINGECLPCHHSGIEDGKFVEGDPVPCADCHTPDGKDGITPLKLAYHKQCQDCHNEAGEGPITCGECHIQKDFFGMPLGAADKDAKAEGEKAE